MSLSLDELLLQLRQHRLILISEREIWPSPNVTQELHKAMRKHRSGLRVLIAWSSIGTCPARDLHRPYYRYRGNQQYECPICAGLLKEVACH